MASLNRILENFECHLRSDIDCGATRGPKCLILGPAPVTPPSIVSTSYNRVAGQSVERLAGLSDGIFGVAMTLLVLDIRLPDRSMIHSEHDLWLGVVALGPQLLLWAMSLMTLGIFWVGQQTQLNHIAHSDRHFTWIHIVFLFAITLLPFSTKLLAQFATYRIALLVYWLNLAVIGAIIYASWGYAYRAGLLRPETPEDTVAAVCRRVKIAQALYAFGALLCIFGTTWSIIFIILVQLNYAIAPRFRRQRVMPRA